MDVPATLVVLPWADPVIDPIGHDPRSRYVELFWLGVLGPTATLLPAATCRAALRPACMIPVPAGILTIITHTFTMCRMTASSSTRRRPSRRQPCSTPTTPRAARATSSSSE